MPRTLRDVNVACFLSRAAARHPERAAISYGARRLNYRELEHGVATLASRFGELGLERGDRLCIFMANSDAYLISLFAAWYAGLVAVPVNSKLHASELGYILEHSGSRGLVFDGKAAGTVAAIERAPQLLFGVDTDAPLDLRRLVAGERRLDAPVDAMPRDVAWLFYTSGTTGRPKGAALTHGNLLAATMSMLVDVCDITEHDRLFHLAPLSHGSGVYALPGIMRGAEHVMSTSPSFDPAAALHEVEERRITVLPFLAPTMLVMLLAAGDADTSSLRRVVWGGAPMHIEHHRAALERFGPILCQIYGQGEAPMTISVMPARLHPLPDELLQTAGRACENVEVAILDADDNVLPPGVAGEIGVRGDVVMDGYWLDGRATAEAMRGGWLHTGDVGVLNEAGWLRLLERKKEVIISGGSNIYPREVEEALLKHPSVAQVCVFGAPDSTWGEQIVAAVVLRAGSEVGADELIATCRQSLASFKKPRVIEFHDALPTNAYGKVLRRQLAADFAERSSRVS
jgi:long-chain acyl-CoA synthetase